MNKKYISKYKIAFVYILIFSGLLIAPGITNAFANNNDIEMRNETVTIKQLFSSPIITQDEEYVKIYVEEAKSYLTNPGQPKLPVFTKTIEFPWGTKIDNIELTHSEIKKISISKKIELVSQPNVIGIKSINNENNIDSYSSENKYPSSWFTYQKGAGVNKNGKPVLYLFIKICPVRYTITANTIEYIESISLKISSFQPNYVESKLNVCDLVIIAPAEYQSNLQSLIAHKERYGVKTNLTTVNMIYNIYPGRDKAEQIKYFIKHAYDEWGIKYVLFVGDIKKIPIRTTYACWFEPDLLSDLYYGDLYNSEFEFCSWDGNENDRFGEIYYSPQWHWPPDVLDVDDVDLCAEVHVGRLSCVSKEEVDIVVNKIINYEKESYGDVWFKKIILAGGDTFPPGKGSEFNHFEGEVTNSQVAQQLPDFDKVKLWATKHNLNAFTFNKEINKGAGFLSYAGHGFEFGWGTYRPNQLYEKMTIFTNPMYYTMFVKYLKNQYRLPIIFFDACLTAKLDYNITDMAGYSPILTKFATLFSKIENDPSVFYPCFAWTFVQLEGGGAIGTIGATRTAYSMVSKDGVEAGAGLLDVEFFKAYGQNGIDILGEILTQAQIGYMEKIGKDHFTIEEYILLGDPSLKVGGYS